MTVFLETTGVNQMMYMMDEERRLTDADRKIVSDGQTAHKNIFELEKQKILKEKNLFKNKINSFIIMNII